MDDEAILSSDVVRAEEENPVIVVTALKSIFENSSVRVVQFKDWMSCILVFSRITFCISFCCKGLVA